MRRTENLALETAYMRISEPCFGFTAKKIWVSQFCGMSSGRFLAKTRALILQARPILLEMLLVWPILRLCPRITGLLVQFCVTVWSYTILKYRNLDDT
jgi:hypothetical protein